MEILYYQNDGDKKKILDMCRVLMEKDLLVPCLGSGFSKGISTLNGIIPDGKTFKRDLIALLNRFDKEITTKEDIDEVSKSFNELADFFWSRCEDNQLLKKGFIKYCNDNFANSRDIPVPHKQFLNSGWKSIFSLNYDDVIEKVIPSISIILPYHSQNEIFLEESKCLYKLHGDIKEYLVTGDPRHFIMGKRLYVDTIKNPQNKEMLDKIKLFSYSKSFLFVGCSLADELDLLYASEFGIEHLFCGIDLSKQAHICLHFSEDNKILNAQIQKYRNYGISHLLIVNSQEDYNDFYIHINSIRNNITSVSSLRMEAFSGIKTVDNKNVDWNIHALFNIGTVFKEFHKRIISLPLFVIDRTISKGVVHIIEKDRMNIFLIYGRFFSGKTLCLLSIMRMLTRIKVYFFPSSFRISDDCLDDLVKNNNTVFLFDTNSIQKEQISKVIREHINVIKDNKLYFVFMMAPSDRRYYCDYLIEKCNCDEERICTFRLENKFDEVEAEEFNSAIGALSLLPYEPKISFLDYLIKESEAHIATNVDDTIIPPVNIIEQKDISSLKAMIVLATEDVVSADNALRFNIDDALRELENKTLFTTKSSSGSLIEKDYGLPTTSQGPGFSFVHNSKFWILLVLKKYIESFNCYDNIVEAYRQIITDFSKTEKKPARFYRQTKRYYMFDVIQSLFINDKNGGWLLLVEKIYDGLSTILCDSFQFLHQKAKCELRVVRFGTSISPREYLSKAMLNITRAIALAEKQLSPDNDSIFFSITHMEFTKLLILINCSMKTNEKSDEAIVSLYEYTKKHDYLKNIDPDDIHDIKCFVNKLIRKEIYNVSNKNKALINMIITNYCKS